MNYLLDTNILVFLLRNKFNVQQKILDIGIDNCAISEITLAELIYGAYCSDNIKSKIESINKLIKLFSIIPIGPCLEKYAEFKSNLRRKGLPIDDFDILIAATAAYNNFILVTDNIKHFNRIPINIVNWIER